MDRCQPAPPTHIAYAHAQVELFLKVDFGTHLLHASPCSTHCLRHAFARPGQPGQEHCACPESCGDHGEHCSECDLPYLLMHELECALQAALPSMDAVDKEDYAYMLVLLKSRQVSGQ